MPQVRAMLASVASREVEEFVTELRFLPEGWYAVGGIFLVALLCWAVISMYRREGRAGASPAVRMVLSGLRCLVILVLAAIFLEPVRVRILRRWIDSYTVVLVDDSSSMDLSDRYLDEFAAQRVRWVMEDDDTSVRRADIVKQLLSRRDRQMLHALSDNNRIKLYSFSDEPRLAATIRGSRENPPKVDSPATTADGKNPGDRLTGVDEAPIDITATGAATNLERAFRRAVESLGSAPIAAAVVFSDGGFNQGAAAEEIGRFARDHRIPIHAVGLGNADSPRNVRVTDILAPPNAFQKDPFAITAHLAAEGLDGQTVQVQLRERTAGDEGGGNVVEAKEATIGPGGAVGAIVFSRRQERVGRFVYSVEVPPLEGEAVGDDNRRQTTVNVIDTRTKVLIVAGGPSWDYLYVSRLLERDDTFDVSCWLQSADASAVRDGDVVIDHLPATAEELFAYDVIIFMDPDQDELDEGWCRLLDTAVTEYGTGLLYASARPRTPGLLRDRTLKPLHDLLPITLDPEADIVLNEIGHYQLSGSTAEVPATAFGHPIMQLSDDFASTKLRWQGVGDVHWYYPVLREKPVATVLMRHGHPRMRNAHGGHVLAAVQFVGAGRTGFLGFDATWRWRRHGVAMFDRFWVQWLRWLAEGKLLGGAKRGMLATESDEFSLGQTVTVTAKLLDRQFKPLPIDQVGAGYQVEDERGEFMLTARRDSPGWFEGRFIPGRTGNYRLSVTPADPDAAGPTEIVKEIQVSRPNLEILRPQMDRIALTTLAEQSHNGRYFEIDEVDQLPALIPDLHEEIPIRSRPTTLWDNATVLTILLAMLAVEWGVRKWNRLL